MMKIKQFIKGFPNTEKYLLIIIILYIIVVSIVSPSFFSLETLFDIIRSDSGTMILAVGILVVMISGGIDVSSTAIAIVSAHIAVRIMIAWNINSMILPILIAMVVGAVFGILNAVLIQIIKLEPFIVTLGTGNIIYGLAAILLGTDQIAGSAMTERFRNFGSLPLFTLTVRGGQVVKLTRFIVPVIIVLVVTWFILSRTKLGKGIFAMGCSEEAAKKVGFRTFRIRLFVYCFAGSLAGLAGMIQTAKVNQLSPTGLVGTELSVIAAVVIGGALPSGGKGRLFGTVLGILIMALFSSTLVLLGFSSSWKDLFTGIVLLVSIVLTSWQQRVKNRNNFIFTE